MCVCGFELALLFFVVVIVKASSGPRYVVGCRNKVNKVSTRAWRLLLFAVLYRVVFIDLRVCGAVFLLQDKLKAGVRIALDMTTFTIMRSVYFGDEFDV